jgi:cytochrome b pre-mRNA-processing protein 3
MFRRLRRRDRQSEAIATSLYGAIVAQARSPALYSHMGVPDTVEGRFEMVVLHLSLVLRRLRGEDAAGQPIAQEVFDLFCNDMDRSLRALGVGDLIVPKRMKKMGAAFYGRAAAYDAALDAGDRPALADALARNVFGEVPEGDSAALAAYVLAVTVALQAIPGDDLRAGRLHFPDAALYAASAAA